MRMNAYAISYLLSIIVAVFFTFLFFKERKKGSGFLKALLILDGAIWILGKFLEIMVSDMGLKSLLGKIQYVGLSMHPVVVLFLTLIACGFGRLVNRKTAILAGIIPFASFLLFITNDFHHLMYKNQAVNEIGLLTVNSINDYGTLLWISTGFSYLMVCACLFFLIYVLITKYIFFKYQALLMILGISVQLFLSIFIIFLKDAGTNLVIREIAPIIILFSDIIFVVGFSYFKVGEIIPINYRHIIEDIKDPIIVLDNNNKMNFVNNSAKKFFGIDDKYIGRLFEDYWHEYKDLVLEEENGGTKKDIEVNLLKNRMIYELNVSILGRNPKDPHGKVLLFRDVTDRKNTEERIKYLSFHDSLTGLYNRAYFDEELHRFDVARQLPLSVIIGDVNGLKVVNDSYGHLEGDKLLSDSAKVLQDSCRNEDMISRWGGDEFMILLPKTDEEKAFTVINRIRKNAAKCKGGKIPVSIALGTATKKEINEDINDIINMAENQMYMQKIVDKNNSSNKNLIKSGEDFYRTGGMTEAAKEKMKKLLELLSEP